MKTKTPKPRKLKHVNIDGQWYVILPTGMKVPYKLRGKY